MAYLKHDPSFPSVMHWPVVAAGGPKRALIDIARRDQLTVHIHESHNLQSFSLDGR